jgi:palmitoyltransferase ZDHHC13/17
LKKKPLDEDSSDDEFLKRSVRLGSIDGRKELLKPRVFSSIADDSARDIAISCSDLIVANNLECLTTYLATLPRHLQIHRIIDDEGYTLLHMAAFQDRTKIFKLLISKAKAELRPEELLIWINNKTQEDQFNALHYAAWKGNIHIMKILIENGAEKYSKNAYGLNCLHIAAQSDQAISLYYFKQLGMNIYSRSNDGLTPLHWACHSNSEIAMIYLLAWYDTTALNMKDKEGSTPLLLTIKSADELGSGRPMRAMLMAGADKEVLDKKKKNAKWYASKL